MACGLGLILTLLPTAPVCAAHWTYSVSGTATTGGASPTTTDISTGPARGIASFSNQSTQQGNADGSTVTATASISATVTATWTPESPTDTDPAPPSVLLDETSEASASGTLGGVTQLGTCSDGIGDTKPDANGTVRGHKYVASGGGTSFTFKVALTATTSITSFQPYTDSGGQFHDGTAICKASVGPCNFAVHAQPYNFHKIGLYHDTPNTGDLRFVYDWSSTDGNKAALTTCYFHEYVTYPGGNPYHPPLPFQLTNPKGLDNPTIRPTSDTTSMATTLAQDTQGYWPSVATHSYKVTSASQQYQFNDSATGEKNVLIPGPDSTASIVRSIRSRPGYTAPWWYSVTKQEAIDWVQLQ